MFLKGFMNGLARWMFDSQTSLPINTYLSLQLTLRCPLRSISCIYHPILLSVWSKSNRRIGLLNLKSWMLSYSRLSRVFLYCITIRIRLLIYYWLKLLFLLLWICLLLFWRILGRRSMSNLSLLFSHWYVKSVLI